MRYLILLIYLFSAVFIGSAQRNFIIDDVVPGGKSYKKFQPQLSKFKFSKDGKTLFLLDDTSVRIFDNVTHVVGKVLFNLEDLNVALQSLSFNELTKLPDFEWGNSKDIYFLSNDALCCYDIASKSIKYSLPIEGESKYDIAPKGSLIAYDSGNALIISEGNDKKFVLGDSQSSEILYGKVASRNEFGISKGTFWSPSGKYLAFYRINESAIAKYPIIDYKQPIPSVSYINYPMVGTSNQLVCVGILDVTNGKIKYINDGEGRDRYFTNITWSPDESSIYIAEIDRSQQNLDMVRYDIDGMGSGTVIFSENESKYIEPENGIVFNPKNTKEFIWMSRRDGYNHLYKYNTTGDILRQLTKGKWEVADIHGFTSDGKNLIFEANKESPIENHVYKLDINKGNITLISAVEGFHSATMSSNGALLLDKYSNPELPGVIELYNFSNSNSRVISSAFNPLKKERMPKIELVKLKADDDSTILYGRLITPPGFDAKKKYPVIVYVYGGPHSQLVTNKWLNGASMWDLYMAQKGYVVFTLDNRGTSNRGKEFEQTTYLCLGQNEMLDQMRGVDYLCKLPYIDKNWIGVFGWSFGGFMTISLMENYADRFKVGVAGGPVIDWKMYEIMYGERYMSTPQNNEEGYERANLLKGVSAIEGKLMVIHGSKDPVVLWKQSIDFLNKAVEERVPIDYFIYPNHEHNVVGGDRVHLMDKITEYFDDYLR